ncbi:hypothetical protein BGW80DRAFT_1277688 [Lactifluus volemus]|nr:hypothetical protein BGW80DRAFT_1277688 [Lactifluus volemus]
MGLASLGCQWDLVWGLDRLARLRLGLGLGLAFAELALAATDSDYDGDKEGNAKYEHDRSNKRSVLKCHGRLVG